MLNLNDKGRRHHILQKNNAIKLGHIEEEITNFNQKYHQLQSNIFIRFVKMVKIAPNEKFNNKLFCFNL